MPKLDQKFVCIYGNHDPSYPRNRSVIETFESLKIPFFVVQSKATWPWRHFVLMKQAFFSGKKIGWIWVTEGGHRLIPWLKLLCIIQGLKIVFDPFLSRYDSQVVDRKQFPKNSVKAKTAFFQDWVSVKLADYLIFDSLGHLRYFKHRYHYKSRADVFPVTAPRVFQPIITNCIPPHSELNNPFITKVLFYGTFIPLQGVCTILRAANLLFKNSQIKFFIIGSGQDSAEFKRLLISHDSSNVYVFERVKEEILPQFIAFSDIVLGVFGESNKCNRVVPNKVIQAAAMGKCILTGQSFEVSKYFQENESIAFCKRGCAESLSEKILELSQSPSKQKEFGAGALAVYRQNFSQDALNKKMKIILSQWALN